jgi:hypothetical protein
MLVCRLFAPSLLTPAHCCTMVQSGLRSESFVGKFVGENEEHMKRTTADVQSGDHSFRLEVWEESPGVYRSLAFERDIEFGFTGQDKMDGIPIHDTMEGEKAYVEAALRSYLKLRGLPCPDGIPWR